MIIEEWSVYELRVEIRVKACFMKKFVRIRLTRPGLVERMGDGRNMAKMPRKWR